MRRVMFIVLLVLSVGVYAQPGGPRGREGHPKGPHNTEQVRMEKIAFFTERIGLTPEEAQQFWPLYNEMEAKRGKLFESRSAILKKMVDGGEMLSEKEIDSLLLELQDVIQQEKMLPVEYGSRFKEVLGSKKMMRYCLAEMDFVRYLMKKLRKPEGVVENE